MGKIVKYCAACEESFAEKFAFCPNCGNAMEAFEMNPLKETVKAEEVAPIATDYDEVIAQTPLSELSETSPNVEPAIAADTTAFSTAGETQTFADVSDLKDDDVEPEIFDDSETKDFEDKAVEVAADEPEIFAVAAAAAGAGGNGNQYQAKNYQPSVNKNIPSDDGFHVTVIQEKNVKQRNGLLLGAMVLMLTLVTGGMIYSIFNHPLLVGAIGDDEILAYVQPIDETPMEIEKPAPKDPGDGGGGGGGGRNDKAPISKGELPPQFKDKPLLTPSKEDISVSNPSLAVMRATQGPDDIMPKKRSAVNGDPNSTNTTPSNGYSKYQLGMGQNGDSGIGNNGRNGVGANGEGGRGLSPGSNYGDKNGPGGNGPDRDTTPPAPPKPPVGVTEKIKFISKPKASYTDQARTNQIQGTVRLRVTFSASGQVGSISPVSGLPYGLTEQAIAAARQIRFEPAKRNGVPIPTTAVVEYNFNIY